MASTTRPAVLAARTKAQQALRLRMSGATLQQIADRLGYNSRQAVWKATTSLLERQEREASAEWQAFHLVGARLSGTARCPSMAPSYSRGGRLDGPELATGPIRLLPTGHT